MPLSINFLNGSSRQNEYQGILFEIESEKNINCLEICLIMKGIFHKKVTDHK